MGFVVYVNRSHDRAIIHDERCSFYQNRLKDRTKVGYWTGVFKNYQEALDFLRFSWGTTGCTIRVPVNGEEIIAFWCYSPIASFGPAFSISLREIKRKVEALNIGEIKAKFRDTNLFEEQGEVDLKLDFSKDLTENDVEKIISLLEELVSEILGKNR